jgi:ABC-type sugar transport system permease subunit
MPGRLQREEIRLAWWLLLPSLLAILVIGAFPLGWTLWESFHLHDLRMPWLGRPFIGAANYLEAATDPRFWGAFAHTAGFTLVSVGLELILGLGLALAMHRIRAGRGLFRAAVLLPWAMPTVVSAMMWRFMFEGHTGVVNASLVGLGMLHTSPEWLLDPVAAWVPVVLADVWKHTPFVALLLLAGLQGIDPELYQAARIDGASAWGQFRYITLPLLRPAILVTLIFRSLDAFRVFDLIYALTGGGPGSSTESLGLYTFNALLQNLRFGYGSALSVIAFALTFLLALAYIRLLGSLAGASR